MTEFQAIPDAAGIVVAGEAPTRSLTSPRPMILAVLFLFAMAIVVAFGPVLSPYRFDQQDLDLIGRPTAPGPQHWLGTDELGRDLLTRLLVGGRISLAVGLASALISTLLGTLVGGLAGFYGRLVDQALMRLTDVMLSMPLLPLILLLSGLFRPDVPLLVLVIGGLTWMSTARVVRSQFLQLRSMNYVEAARALGAGNARLMLRHILPNASGPIIVSATLAVGGAIMLESAMSFLGFGVQPPVPSWGNMLKSATPWLGTAPWMALPPGLLIFATTLSVNLLGNGFHGTRDQGR